MLGSIRHRGFIPWDDDMDFGVPREYYDLLIDALERELPSPYRCCTYNNNPGVYSPFIKIDNYNTVVDDPRVREILDKQIGVSIDVFPLDYCNPNDISLNKIYRLLLIYQSIYVGNSSGTIWKNLAKSILSKVWPISRIQMLDLMNLELTKLKKGPILTNVFGAWKKKECIPIEWYGEGTEYTFEDTSFSGLVEYDKYLKQLYGDYLTPPKVDKHIHYNSIFWRD